MKRVDDTARTVTLKFKGAPSGEYLVYLSSKSQGRLDVGEFTESGITTRSRVTAISPLEGSALGGSIVTITGENFSTNAQENPVMIGNTLCLISSSTPTEIVC